MFTNINSEDRLVQKTFADYLHDVLGWEGVYAWKDETFGPGGNLGRDSERDAVLKRDLREALARLNPTIPPAALDEALQKLTQVDYARSLVQHNQQFYKYILGGVPVSWRDSAGETHDDHARVIDFQAPANNRFVAVREMKFQGLRVPHYNRRAAIVCFVNGLPLVFIELKAVYRNIRQGFDNNLTDYMTEQVIPQAFHHNAFLIVSNGDRAKYPKMQPSFTGKHPKTSRCRSSNGRIPSSAAWEYSGTRRGAASRIRWSASSKRFAASCAGISRSSS